MSDDKQEKSLVKAENGLVADDKETKKKTSGEKMIDAEVTSSKDEDAEKPVKETRYTTKSDSNLGGIFLAVIALLLVFAMFFMGYRYVTTGTATHSSEDANAVMQEQEAPALKTAKLNPQKVYALKGASDRLNNLEVSITKAQFRKDGTRLWIHVKNDGGQKISMMPTANATLVDNNGHSYKVDSFSGDQTTSVAPGTDEEIMLVFEPVRADAKEITFGLDGVFDMKHSAWSYNITVELP